MALRPDKKYFFDIPDITYKHRTPQLLLQQSALQGSAIGVVAQAINYTLEVKLVPLTTSTCSELTEIREAYKLTPKEYHRIGQFS